MVSCDDGGSLSDINAQGALHRRSGVSQSTIDRIVGAEVSATIDTLDKIAGALGFEAWQLLAPDLHLGRSEPEFYAKLRALLDEADGLVFAVDRELRL